MKGRAIAIAFGIGTVAVILVLLLSIVVGPLLGFEHLLPNDGGVLLQIWSYVRWPFIAGAVVAWIGVLLSVGPGTGVRWRRALPGAVFAAAGVAAGERRLRAVLPLHRGRQPRVRRARWHHRRLDVAPLPDHRLARGRNAERHAVVGTTTPACHDRAVTDASNADDDESRAARARG